MKHFDEQTRLDEQSRIDEDSGVVHNVKVLGRISRNNRVYESRALDDVAELADGTAVHLDHPARGELQARDGIRSVTTLAARIRRPRRSGDEVRGDLELLDIEPNRSFILAAARAPGVAALSIRGQGDVKVDESGTQRVRRVKALSGVDLVAEGATADTLFERALTESRRRRGSEFRPVTDDVILRASRELFV